MHSLPQYLISFLAFMSLWLIFGSLNSAANDKNINTASNTTYTNIKYADSLRRSAIEGVELLEKILLRMRAMPQVALVPGQRITPLRGAEKARVFAQAPTPLNVIASAKRPQSYLQKQDEIEMNKSLPLADGDSRMAWAPNIGMNNPLRMYAPSPASSPSTGLGSEVRGRILKDSASGKLMSNAANGSESINAKKIIDQAHFSNFDRSPPLIQQQQAADTSFQSNPSEPEQSQLKQEDAFHAESNSVSAIPKPMKAAHLILKDKKGTAQNLALLPPTVIKGIPLISLGNSEQVALRAIAKNKNLALKKEPIHGWSVYSVKTNNSPDTAIQIFLRNGVVEAIRVFDPFFLRPDFGIALGDDLFKVKEKFGEPAFIVSEKRNTYTQNYIYPLNQVGFQFSRSTAHRRPEITSLLIFNVQ